jgi:hypothetical protein
MSLPPSYSPAVKASGACEKAFGKVVGPLTAARPNHRIPLSEMAIIEIPSKY